MKRLGEISGNIVDVLSNRVYPGTLVISGARIIAIRQESRTYDTFIIPGLIDSHVHIESSMLVPSEFARFASLHGTVAAVSDPHEIANVLGMEGVHYMIRNGTSVPFKFFFGAPSCVPATPFETAGARIDDGEIEELLKREEIRYLSEMMNFHGVLAADADVMKKLEVAGRANKKIDGHAPGLTGENVKRYIGAGITTDHECTTREEALEKIKYGMKIMIREGSAAKNFDALAPLIEDHPGDCMFCTDDMRPDDLLKGHMNGMVKRALVLGLDKMKVLRVACVNTVLHYGLDVGLLREGDSADFVVIDNFEDFRVLRTVIAGKVVAEYGKSLMPEAKVEVVNKFNAEKKDASDFSVKKSGETINVIEAADGQLITNRLRAIPKVMKGYVVSDPDRDILKISVVNRYEERQPATGFIKGFGLKRGAIASSVAHDSHNVLGVGVTDEELCRAVNLIIENKGGLSAVHKGTEKILPLPIAGIMSRGNGYEVAKAYSELDGFAKQLGSGLKAPFMTLSFMALLVIPKIKLSDRGLFDGERFTFIDLFEAD